MTTETLGMRLARITARARKKKDAEEKAKKQQKQAESEKKRDEDTREAVEEFLAEVQKTGKEIAKTGENSTWFNLTWGWKTETNYEDLLSFAEVSEISKPLREFCQKEDLILSYKKSENDDEVRVIAIVTWPELTD